MSGILRIDMKAVEAAMEELSHLEGAFEPLFERSLNKAIGAARNEAVKRVKRRYTIEDDGIRNQVKVRKARSGDLEAYFTNSSRPTPLDKFEVNPKSPHSKGRARRPVTAEVIFGENRSVDDAFIAEMKNTKVGVFRRVGRDRLPIKMLYGPSLAQMLSHDEVVNATEKRASTIMNRELEKGVEAAISGMRGVKK